MNLMVINALMRQTLKLFLGGAVEGGGGWANGHRRMKKSSESFQIFPLWRAIFRCCVKRFSANGPIYLQNTLLKPRFKNTLSI